MFFGSIATIVSMLLVGPSPLFPIIEKYLSDVLRITSEFRNLIVIGVALSVLGVAAGALYIPTFQNCLDAVK